MLTILLGVLNVFLDSIGNTYYKISLNLGNISTNLFKVFALFGNLLIVLFIVIFQPFFLTPENSTIIILSLTTSILRFINSQFWLQILRKDKLSTLLPYNNLDKIFTVIIGFFIYANTPNSVSYTTLFITLFTIIVIFIGSVDIKKIVIPKSIVPIFMINFVKAILYLVIAYILLHINSGEFFVIKWLGEGIIILAIAFIFKENFLQLFKQSRKFYITRAIPSLLGGTTYLIALYIIETSGIIIATLLGFFSVAFNILAMRFIAKDNPNIKQIGLAVVVIILIGIGYYFK